MEGTLLVEPRDWVRRQWLMMEGARVLCLCFALGGTKNHLLDEARRSCTRGWPTDGVASSLPLEKLSSRLS